MTLQYDNAPALLYARTVMYIRTPTGSSLSTGSIGITVISVKCREVVLMTSSPPRVVPALHS